LQWIQLAIHERGVAILILDKPRAVQSIVIQPHAVNCHGAGQQIILETHSRPDPLCAAFSVQHRWLSPGHPEGRQSEVGDRCGILLPATDAARRPGPNVVLYGDRLFQQYVVDACAKME